MPRQSLCEPLITAARGITKAAGHVGLHKAGVGLRHVHHVAKAIAAKKTTAWVCIAVGALGTTGGIWAGSAPSPVEEERTISGGLTTGSGSDLPSGGTSPAAILPPGVGVIEANGPLPLLFVMPPSTVEHGIE